MAAHAAERERSGGRVYRARRERGGGAPVGQSRTCPQRAARAGVLHLPVAGRFTLLGERTVERLRISDLAKRTSVSGRTLRYWESRGLLPRAARSHSGYRVFGPESIRQVEFIQKAKSIGLTLGEVGRVLKLARGGQDPCGEVARWMEEKILALEEEMDQLSGLRRRLEQLHRQALKRLPCPRRKPYEICCLIEGLPSLKSRAAERRHRNAKALVAATRRVGGAGH
jgi:DNA-binding transcriptional MerR regulator